MTTIPEHIRSLEAYAARSGARLVRAALPEAVHGRVCSDLIMLRADLDPEQELLALVHELTHWLAHRNAPPQQAWTVFEYEAEAVEALVMERLGIRPSTGQVEAGASPTDDLLSASVTRVIWASGRICEALGL